MFKHIPVEIDQLKRKNTEKGRRYQTPSGVLYPSVTTGQAREPKKENTEKYETRMKSSNRFLDEDIVPFWNSYKGTLEKLCLDHPLYK